jgi:hypothetical protein
MNISGAAQQYACGQYTVTCCKSSQQGQAGTAVTTPADPATASDASGAVPDGQDPGAVHRHHHHHHHGHHGHMHAGRHAGWQVQGRNAACDGQASPHAAVAKALDDAVDTLTQQVSGTLADLPAGADTTQVQQVADLQSGFIESIRDVAAQFRVHDLGRKDAQAGLQQAFDTLTTGLSAIFPDQTAGTDPAPAPGGESATAAAPVQAAAAGSTTAVADTAGSTPPAGAVNDAGAAADSTVVAATDAGSAPALLQSLETIFAGVKESLQSGLHQATPQRDTAQFGNIEDLFRKFVAFYQEMSAAGAQGTDTATPAASSEVSLVA